MNTYINTVTTNPASFNAPSVTYNSTTEQIVYSKNMRYTSDKTQAKPGDIVLHYHDSDTVWFASPDYYSTHMYPTTEDGDDMYAIGVVVVPSSHTSDGTVRIVSAKYMDYNDPESGSTSRVSMMWGDYSTDIAGLTNYTSVVVIVPGTSTTSTNSYSYLPTTFHRYKFLVSTVDPIASYASYAVLNESYLPSPYTSNGGKSTIYHTSGYALADMNGADNTDAIMDAVTIDWEDTITNSSGVGNYPAASCCRRYYVEDSDDQYFGHGNWYLPSIGELGYLCARFEEIDRSRRMLGSDSMWGGWYWSSSECSSSLAWYLRLGEYYTFGGVYGGTKDGSYSVVAFCSF